MLRAYFGPSASPVGEAFLSTCARCLWMNLISHRPNHRLFRASCPDRLKLPFDGVNEARAVLIRPSEPQDHS
ncbi:MAG: hypothetical protein DBW82_03180 [Synechococcus sp. MED-G68]|nr:MAG: hypothetical protein DBW82_03180 [Synechococcus sp. MED-G68]